MDASPSSWSSAISSRDYAVFVRDDPMRNALHYPSVLQILGNVSGRLVLDLGCGDGRFDRLLAENGANVSAFDIVPAQITEAKQQEDERPLGIQYEVADATTYRADRLYHDAVSVLVLPYAADPDTLRSIFKTAYSALLESGRFISVVFNPEFSEFGTVIGNRQFHREELNKVRVEFLHPQTGATCFTSHLRQFSRKQYEKNAQAVGFGEITWINPEPTPESEEKLGERFWKTCKQENPYMILNVKR